MDKSHRDLPTSGVNSREYNIYIYIYIYIYAEVSVGLTNNRSPAENKSVTYCTSTAAELAVRGNSQKVFFSARTHMVFIQINQ